MGIVPYTIIFQFEPSSPTEKHSNFPSPVPFLSNFSLPSAQAFGGTSLLHCTETTLLFQR